jgi:hypothetical protein
LPQKLAAKIDDLVQEAVAGFVDELTAVRHMLDTRYDDVKSGRVEPVDGEEAFTRLRGKGPVPAQSWMSGYAFC